MWQQLSERNSPNANQSNQKKKMLSSIKSSISKNISFKTICLARPELENDPIYKYSLPQGIDPNKKAKVRIFNNLTIDSTKVQSKYLAPRHECNKIVFHLALLVS